MFDVGAGEMIFIVLAVLLLFGPKKIPEVAQMLGKGLREFRRAQDGLRAQIREVTSEMDDPFSDKPVAAAPKPFTAPEPTVIEKLHEPEAPGQMSLMDNAPKEIGAEGNGDIEKPEFLKPVIQPAPGSVARQGRISSPPPPDVTPENSTGA